MTTIAREHAPAQGAAARAATRLYGALAYGLTLAAFAALFAFLADIGLPITVDRGRATPFGVALAIDVSLVALFGLQHSIMARPTFKRWWTRRIPARLERSTYMMVTNGVLALLFWQWRPIPDVIWETHGAARAVLFGTYVFGWVFLFVSIFLLDHLELTGLRQTWTEAEERAPRLLKPLLYRLVRHPMMLGWLIIFWATPRMTAGHLVFAAAMTVYILVALPFEERNLVDTFGDDYRRYQREVPRLVPGVHRLRRRRRS